jgi:hypothetical protein
MKAAIPLACVLALVMLSASALAENMLFLGMDVNSDLEITGYDFYVTDSASEPYSDKTGLFTMSLEILSGTNDTLYSTEFALSFLLLSDPPQEISETSTLLILPYLESAEYIRIYHNNTEKLSLEIRENLCNSNGFCDNFESHYSCPDDCSIYAGDGVCASISFDGGCDPDCPPQLDLDCSCPNGVCEDWESHRHCPGDCPSGREDGYCDGIRDKVCDPDCERKEDIDCTCPDQVCQIFETYGTCPQDCPPEYQEAAGSFIQEYWIYILLLIAALIILAALARKRKPKRRDEWKPIYRKAQKP